ncbi:MAG: Uma2 family endonuclease [Prochloron sp. SP5CPC1]|nr:Uma2 family endonuclease [Candidatus Paraprochloron terpiosi SP5CPC1]
MVSTIVTQPAKLSLERFLELPETEPAREYIDGVITQKPMPKGTHSRLQAKLVTVINQNVEAEKIAYAFPELRCTFGGRSIVSDLAVFTWDRIPFTSTGRVPENFVLPPDWAIEILSPDQSPNLVIGKLLHCIQHGSSLGWFLDPNHESVLIFQGGKQPELLRGDAPLLVLPELDLELTAAEIYSWLILNRT